MNFKKILFFVIFVLPSALFTSDHPIEQAVQLPQTIYKKGDLLDSAGRPVFLDFYGKPVYLNSERKQAFEVLADEPAVSVCLYVEHLKTGKTGLFDIVTKCFKPICNCGEIADTLERVAK